MRKNNIIYLGIIFVWCCLVLIFEDWSYEDSSILEKTNSSSEIKSKSVNKDSGQSSVSSSNQSSSSSYSSCTSGGAKSFAQERAKNGLSKINKTSSLNMVKISSLGYDSDWGYLIEGINNYGSVTFITVLISCSNGQYSVDFVESS